MLQPPKRPKLDKLNQKADHIQQFFGYQVPTYIRSLPSIKDDAVRWTGNILYFGVGLLYNWAVSAVLRQMPNMHQFPSNVGGMIVLFFILICCHTVKPELTDKAVKFVDPYASFAQRSMNIMFVPAVVEIVNNPPTTGPEIGRMICVFFVAYFLSFLLCTVLVRTFQLIMFHPCLSKRKNTPSITDEKINDNRNRMMEEEAVVEVRNYLPNEIQLTLLDPIRTDDVASSSSTLTDIVIVKPPALTPSSSSLPSLPNDHISTHTIYEAYPNTKQQQDGPLHNIAIWCMQQSNFDDLTLFLIFCFCVFIFLPLPNDSPAVPFFRLFLYFTMTILLYSFACKLLAKLRIVFHPIIVAAACVMAGIGYFERVKGFDIVHGVLLYKSGITFIGLVEKTNVGWPGGGDILATAMDVSIISMAFNIYKSRPDSFREWIIIFASVLPVACLIMFVTPLFAHGIGCSPNDSIVWASRSVTTAIGIVIAKVLDANESIVTCLIIFTGIMGPLFGPFIFRLIGVKDDDFMTIGITMGLNSHGVGTAYLISKNPKASGMASIAFAGMGTIGVIVASIPVLSETIKRLAGVY